MSPKEIIGVFSSLPEPMQYMVIVFAMIMFSYAFTRYSILDIFNMLRGKPVEPNHATCPHGRQIGMLLYKQREFEAYNASYPFRRFGECMDVMDAMIDSFQLALRQGFISSVSKHSPDEDSTQQDYFKSFDGMLKIWCTQRNLHAKEIVRHCITKVLVETSDADGKQFSEWAKDIALTQRAQGSKEIDQLYPSDSPIARTVMFKDNTDSIKVFEGRIYDSLISCREIILRYDRTLVELAKEADEILKLFLPRNELLKPRIK